MTVLKLHFLFIKRNTKSNQSAAIDKQFHPECSFCDCWNFYHQSSLKKILVTHHLFGDDRQLRSKTDLFFPEVGLS